MPSKMFKCYKCNWTGLAKSARTAQSKHDKDRPNCDGTPVPFLKIV